MAIFKVTHEKNYTVVSNDLLRDKNLSLKSIGLLVKVLSLPEDWDFSIEGLASICKDGSTSVSSSLKELEKFGYLVRKQMKDDSGHFVDIEYSFYENPNMNYPYQEKPNSDIKENKTNNNNKLNINVIKEFNKNTKSHKDILNYINGLGYKDDTKEVLIKWFENFKGRVSLQQLEDKLHAIEEKVNGDEDLIKQTINDAYLNNWFGFFYKEEKKKASYKSNRYNNNNDYYYNNDYCEDAYAKQKEEERMREQGESWFADTAKIYGLDC